MKRILKKNQFITIEGIEGAGKSTAVKFVRQLLVEQGVDLVVTREPGGTPFAEKIRNLLLAPGDETVAPDTEVLLFYASRAQHIAQVIKPALMAGKSVLSDRFADASIAYQGGGRGISISHIEALSQWVLGDLQPDLTLLLDLPAEIGLQRISARGEKDRIEQEKIAFFERVRQTYLTLAKQCSERYRIIDASKALEEVQTEIKTVLSP